MLETENILQFLPLKILLLLIFGDLLYWLSLSLASRYLIFFRRIGCLLKDDITFKASFTFLWRSEDVNGNVV
jgi:hypothetical protein